MTSKEHAKILIVEDDAVTRLLLRKMLADHTDWEVTEAEDGLTAWELVEQRKHFDLCITDVQMPRLDGISFLQKVRAHSTARDLKVILCTNCRDRETVLKVAPLGVDHYIVKPFKKDLILERVRQVLGARPAAQLPSVAPSASAPSEEATPASPGPPAPLVRGDLAGFVKRAPVPPSLPTVYQEVMAALNRPDSSIRQVGEVILQDQGLTSRLLKLANSAYYGGRSEIFTVDAAAQIVGLDQIQQLVLTTSLMESFEKIPTELVDVPGFWEHSLVCGIASALLAEYLRDPSPQRLFVAGLLHDIGRLMMFLGAPDESFAILQRCQQERQLACNIEREVLGFDHSDLGAELMLSWGLPKALIESVKNHHLPLKSSSASRDQLIVQYADFIVTTLQFGNSGEFYVAPVVLLGKPEKGLLDSCPIDDFVAELENRCEALLPVILQQRSSAGSASSTRAAGAIGGDQPEERRASSLLPLDQLKVGMEVAEDVVEAKDGAVLLSRGSLITGQELAALQKARIQSVSVWLKARWTTTFPPEVMAVAEAEVDDRLRYVPMNHAALGSLRNHAVRLAASREVREAKAIQRSTP